MKLKFWVQIAQTAITKRLSVKEKYMNNLFRYWYLQLSAWTLYSQWSISHHSTYDIHILNKIVQSQKRIIYVIFVFCITIQVENSFVSFDMVSGIFWEFNTPWVSWCWRRMHWVICKSVYNLVLDLWIELQINLIDLLIDCYQLESCRRVLNNERTQIIVIILNRHKIYL